MRSALRGAPGTMRVHTGTSGFAFAEWVGPFYPEGLRETEMLSWYAGRFDTVEINNTFYRFPTAQGLAKWSSQVPEAFRFAIKVPQRITHHKRLREVDEEIARLIDAVATLGPRLGPLLFLCPPRMPLDVDALEELLVQLPPWLRAAFEFRDTRWHCDTVYALLTANGCALCYNDALMPAPVPTTDWGYVRLRREHYAPEALAASAAEIRPQPWRETYLFLKHEAPDSPLLAQQLADLMRAPSAP